MNNISSQYPAAKTGATGVVPLARSAFWTVYYFFYFLLTGQPEWKCESHEPKPLIACCGGRTNEEKGGQKWNSHAAAGNGSSSTNSRSNGYATHDDYSHQSHHQHHHHAQHFQPHFPPQQGGSFFGRLWAKTKDLASKSWNFLKRGGRWTLENSGNVGKYVWKGLCWLWEKLKAFFSYFSSIKLLPEAARSKSLPPPQLGPKPFSPDSPSFNKVAFNPDETFNNFKQKLETQLKDQFEESQQEEEDADERTLREPSVPPPPPPPPPKTGIRIERTPEPDARYEGPSHHHQERKERPRTPKGVPEMAKEVMAELNERMSRAPSVQRELTQSCHPDMAQWKEIDRYDRSGSATPWRASSVGPTMRRLEQVVSRLDGNDSSDNEAQFVFRPPPTTSRQDGYQMGKSVFNPLEEAERMRESINSKNYYGSRPVTPSSYYTERRYDGGSDLRQRAKTVEPSNYAGRSFTPSLAYSTAPFTSHTARRSKTPVSFDRGANFAFDRNDIQDGVVNRTANRWPPVSNATGAVVERDSWINDMIGGRPDDDGLITTMCRRVVEKKTQDNWKWRDDAGRLLDEQNQRQWKGELDTVVRDGPQQGRQWSRTVEVRPNGTTLFQDVSRQYDRDYVVESVIRNY